MNVLYLSNYNIDIGDNIMTYNVNYQWFIKKKREKNNSSLSWAVDEAWTRDLFLTKEVLYHWATTAFVAKSRAKVQLFFDFANFLQTNLLFPT